MIAVNDKIEFKASVVTVGTNNYDLLVTEILVDGKWETFKIPKPMNILLSDYDPSILSTTELALFKRYNEELGPKLTNPDDIATAASAKAKLGGA